MRRPALAIWSVSGGQKGSNARFNRRFWPMVAFDSVLKIAARVEALTYRDFYEGAQTHANPSESDEPVLTG